MPMEMIRYEEARKRVRAGDVVAFGGNNFLSKIIKATGKTVVSHAGVIVSPLNGNEEPRFAESTVRLGYKDPTWGVAITSFEDRWENYDGEVWLLPLGPKTRPEHFDETSFLDFVASAEGKTFDIPEGLRILIKEFIEELGKTLVEEEYYFCSELVAEAFQVAGTIPKEVDPSDVSPKDLCRWKMYDDTYYLREERGRLMSIRNFNTLPPGATF